MVLCSVTGSNWWTESIQAQHTVLFLALEKKKKSFVDSNNKKNSITVDAPSLFTGGPPPTLFSFLWLESGLVMRSDIIAFVAENERELSGLLPLLSLKR